jgi:penicillin-binding protein 2
VVALSAIANGVGGNPGTIWVPHVGLRITDASNNIIHVFDNEKRSNLDIPVSIMDVIRQGMLLVTSDPHGTAYPAFKGFPIAVAGKTGTAQKLPASDGDYALFMGYAPVDSAPQIAVVAIIEQGGHGSSVAAPVVRRVLEAFFHTSSGSVNVAPTE